MASDKDMMICVAYSDPTGSQCRLSYPAGEFSSRIMVDNSVLLLGKITTGRIVDEQNPNVCERYDMVPVLERGGVGTGDRLRIVCKYRTRPIASLGVPIHEGAPPEVTQIDAISMDHLTSRIFERSMRERERNGDNH